MVAQEVCPDPSRLERMFEGTLPPDDQTVVALHLERCPACQTRFEELANEGKLVPDAELRDTVAGIRFDRSHGAAGSRGARRGRQRRV